jgi:hypothetical protein
MLRQSTVPDQCQWRVCGTVGPPSSRAASVHAGGLGFPTIYRSRHSNFLNDSFHTRPKTSGSRFGHFLLPYFFFLLTSTFAVILIEVITNCCIAFFAVTLTSNDFLLDNLFTQTTMTSSDLDLGLGILTYWRLVLSEFWRSSAQWLEMILFSEWERIENPN